MTCLPSADALGQALPGDGLTIEGAIELALAANPAVAAIRLQSAVDAAGLEVARERPNPEATVELENDAPRESFGLALPLELGGKRAKRIAVGELEVAAGTAERAAAISEVRNAVRRAYFETLAGEERLALLREVREVAGRVREAASERFAAGDVARLEVMQAELALAAAENEAAAAEGEAEARRARLNALLGQPLDRAPALASPLDSGPTPTREEALELARAANAGLRVLDRTIEAQEARVALARALRVPDLVPTASLTHGAQPDYEYGWRAGFALALPLFTTHRGGVLAEESTRERLVADRRALLAQVEAEVTAAATLAATQRQLYLSYRDAIVPQALAVTVLAEASYQLGQTGIAALLQALQASEEVRLRAIDAGAQYQSALADLESAIGAPL